MKFNLISTIPHNLLILNLRRLKASFSFLYLFSFKLLCDYVIKIVVIKILMDGIYT